MIKSALNWLGQKVSGKVIAASVLSAFLASSFIAWAQQTNYLGTVFIADSSTPTRQLTLSSNNEVLVRLSASGVVISAGNPSDGLSNGIQVNQTNALQSWYNGSTWDRQFTCPLTASVNVAAAATTQIVALASSQIIRVCSFVISGDTLATTATFVYGTGSNCATGQVAITGAMRLQDEGNISISSGSGSVMRTAASNALCLTAATGAVTGFITYAQY